MIIQGRCILSRHPAHGRNVGWRLLADCLSNHEIHEGHEKLAGLSPAHVPSLVLSFVCFELTATFALRPARCRPIFASAGSLSLLVLLTHRLRFRESGLGSCPMLPVRTRRVGSW